MSNDDLVARLRSAWSVVAADDQPNPYCTDLTISDEPNRLCVEAADRIDALERELERLRALLENISDNIGLNADKLSRDQAVWMLKVIADIARKALETDDAE